MQSAEVKRRPHKRRLSHGKAETSNSGESERPRSGDSAAQGARKTLHKVWSIWSIRRMPMNEKKWKWPLVTVGVGSNSKNNVMRENILTPSAQGSLCWMRQIRVSEQERHEHQDLSVPATEVGNVSKILNFHDGSIFKQKCWYEERSCPHRWKQP